MADITSVINSLRTNLSRSNTNQAVKFLIDNKIELANNLGEFVPMLTALINSDVENERLPFFVCTKTLLNVIAQEYPYEDVLLQFINEMQELKNDMAFLTLLTPLKTVLLRLPKTKLNFLGWGLNSVTSYLKQAFNSENLNVYGNDENLMDIESSFTKISFLYLPVLDFYNSLIDDFKQGDPFLVERKVILLKFILQLLGTPLAFENLGQDTKSHGECRNIAERIVSAVFTLSSNIFWILNIWGYSEYDIGDFNNLSLATLFYLVLGEGLFINKVPKTYDSEHVFHNSLYLTTELFNQKQHIAVSNGLCLTNALLSIVDGMTLPHQLLEFDHHNKFCLTLIDMIIYNQIKQYRQIGLELFRKYLFLFDTQGRYHLVYNLIKVVKHAGIIGYITVQYKEMFVEEYNKRGMLSEYFRGSNLIGLLNKFCHLHEDESNNLLEASDQIVASLNFLRYLAIRDRTNVTKIWDHFKVLDVQYLQPLKEELARSKFECQEKMKEPAMESTKVDKVKMTINIAGRSLSEFSMTEEVDVLHSAVTAFDMMESLVDRVRELFEDRPWNVLQ